MNENRKQLELDLVESTQRFIMDIMLSVATKRTFRFDANQGLAFDVLILGDEEDDSSECWKYERGYKYGRPESPLESTLFHRAPYHVSYDTVVRIEKYYDKDTDECIREIFYHNHEGLVSNNETLCDMVFGLHLVYDHDLRTQNTDQNNNI